MSPSPPIGTTRSVSGARAGGVLSVSLTSYTVDESSPSHDRQCAGELAVRGSLLSALYPKRRTARSCRGADDNLRLSIAPPDHAAEGQSVELLGLFLSRDASPPSTNFLACERAAATTASVKPSIDILGQEGSLARFMADIRAGRRR